MTFKIYYSIRPYPHEYKLGHIRKILHRLTSINWATQKYTPITYESKPWHLKYINPITYGSNLPDPKPAKKIIITKMREQRMWICDIYGCLDKHTKLTRKGDCDLISTFRDWQIVRKYRYLLRPNEKEIGSSNHHAKNLAWKEINNQLADGIRTREPSDCDNKPGLRLKLLIGARLFWGQVEKRKIKYERKGWDKISLSCAAGYY